MSTIEPELLLERYKQLERNFEAVVTELQERGGEAGEQLQALLSQHDADLKLSLLRAQGSGTGNTQRLEERMVILQRNFHAVVELMGQPTDKSSLSSASKHTASSPRTEKPAVKESSISPFSHHPWQPSGQAYAPPKAPNSRPSPSQRVPASPETRPDGSAASRQQTPPPASPKRYDSFPSAQSAIGSLAVSRPSAVVDPLTPAQTGSQGEVPISENRSETAANPSALARARASAEAVQKLEAVRAELVAAQAEIARQSGLMEALEAREKRASDELMKESELRRAAQMRSAQVDVRISELEATESEFRQDLEEERARVKLVEQKLAAAELAERRGAEKLEELRELAAAAGLLEANLKNATTRIDELESEIELAKTSERNVTLQAQIHAKRAEEAAREQAKLQQQLDELHAEQDAADVAADTTAASAPVASGSLNISTPSTAADAAAVLVEESTPSPSKRSALKRAAEHAQTPAVRRQLLGLAVRGVVRAQLKTARMQERIDEAAIARAVAARNLLNAATSGTSAGLASPGGAPPLALLVANDSLRAELEELREAEQEAQSDLEKKENDLQHLRRVLHTSNAELSAQGESISKLRRLLGSSVRATCTERRGYEKSAARLRVLLDAATPQRVAPFASEPQVPATADSEDFDSDGDEEDEGLGDSAPVLSRASVAVSQRSLFGPTMTSL